MFKIPKVSYNGIYYKWYKLPFVNKYLLFTLILLLTYSNFQNTITRLDAVDWKNSYINIMIGCMNGRGFYFPDTKKAFICEATNV